MGRVTVLSGLVGALICMILGCSSSSTPADKSGGGPGGNPPAEPFVGRWQAKHGDFVMEFDRIEKKDEPLGEGKKVYKVFWEETVHIKADGTYEVDGVIHGTRMQKGSGSWKLASKDKDTYKLQRIPDTRPDRTFGWVITITGPDELTFESGYDGLGKKFRRIK